MTVRRRPSLAEKSKAYRQLWRVVDGAVFDALYMHPDYLTPKGKTSARPSINKRVVGSVLGYVEQSTRGRSGESPAADRVPEAATFGPRTVIFYAVSKGRAICKWVARLFGRDSC